VEDEVRLRQNRQQGMMARPSVLARVVAFQRTFLPAVALEDRRIQIQAVAFGEQGHALHPPLAEWREQPLHIAHAELPEEIADRVVTREAAHTPQGLQGPVAAQPVHVCEPLGAGQHRGQKRGKGRRLIDVVR
jgi:hypothetical protein